MTSLQQTTGRHTMLKLKSGVYLIDGELYLMDDQGDLVELTDTLWAQMLYSVYNVAM